MNKTVKSTLILSLVAFVAAFVLSHVKRITYPNILKQEQEKQQKALLLVLPGFKPGQKQQVKIDGKEFAYWIAERNIDGKKKKGYAFIASKPGYSGDVDTMVGIDGRGGILGISILKQTETPGLGARCTEIASKSTFFGTVFGNGASDEKDLKPWFQEQFSGLKTSYKLQILKKGDWTQKIKKELLNNNAISAITGATITSRTVTESIEDAVVLLKKALKTHVQKSGDIK